MPLLINLFATDAGKQQAMNLFLGIYTPCTPGLPNIWELVTDFYLYNPAAGMGPSARLPSSYSQW